MPTPRTDACSASPRRTTQTSSRVSRRTASRASNDFDAFGRADGVHGRPGRRELPSYGKDSLGREGGFPETVSQGPLFQKLKYDSDDQRGNPTSVETSWGTSSNIEYDEWDRPVKETSGLSAGSYEPVGEVVERAFDEAGHLVTERRTQKGLGTVQTDYFYDDRERLKSVQRTQVAGRDPGSIVPLAETKLEYDNKTGFLKTTTTAAGVVTTYEFDEMGRMKSVTPPSSGKRTFGYDEMGRLTFATDGDDGVWKGTYDAWGGLVREQLPTGAVISREFDAAGGLVSATPERRGRRGRPRERSTTSTSRASARRSGSRRGRAARRTRPRST